MPMNGLKHPIRGVQLAQAVLQLPPTQNLGDDCPFEDSATLPRLLKK